jgi:hypothetical protein
MALKRGAVDHLLPCSSPACSKTRLLRRVPPCFCRVLSGRSRHLLLALVIGKRRPRMLLFSFREQRSFVSSIGVSSLKSQCNLLKFHLGNFLHHTLQSFFQVPRPTPKLSKYSFRNRLDENTKKKMMMDAPFGRDVFKALQKEAAPFRKQRVAICELCRKAEDSYKFMVCKTCQEKLDRRVFYCSV